MTQSLLKMINESGKLHMVPALVNEDYVIRFAVCAENATEENITFAWGVISTAAMDLMSSKSELEKTKKYDRMETGELSETESEDEVRLTFSHTYTLSEASAADDFLKHYGKWRNCS